MSSTNVSVRISGSSKGNNMKIWKYENMLEAEWHDAPERCYSGVTLVTQTGGKIHSVQVIMCKIYLKNRKRGRGGGKQ